VGLAVGIALTAVSLGAVRPTTPTAVARRRPHEAVAVPFYADGHGCADGHLGGADETYSDGVTPTVTVGIPLYRRHFDLYRRPEPSA
jgi:hypothetical protein